MPDHVAALPRPPAAAPRTRRLLEAPLVPTLLRLAVPNLLLILVRAPPLAWPDDAAGRPGARPRHRGRARRRDLRRRRSGRAAVAAADLRLGASARSRGGRRRRGDGAVLRARRLGAAGLSAQPALAAAAPPRPAA